MKINFDKLNLGKKARNLVVGTALVMSPLAGDAQEAVLKDLPLNYDTIENPLNKPTIDFLEADSFQNKYPLYIPDNQDNWERINQTYFMDGFQYAKKESFNPNKIRVAKDLKVTHINYFLLGVMAGWESLSEKEQEKREKNAENAELARKGKKVKKNEHNQERRRRINGIIKDRINRCPAARHHYQKGNKY